MHVCTNALQHVACGKWQRMCVLMREVTFEMRFVRCMLCMLVFVIVIVVVVIIITSVVAAADDDNFSHVAKNEKQ